MQRWLTLIGCALVAASAHAAQPAIQSRPLDRTPSATAQFAPFQLEVAQQSLSAAEQALAAGDIIRAQRFADQADLDARLAWSMTDSQAVRLNAEQLARAAADVTQRVRASVVHVEAARAGAAPR